MDFHDLYSSAFWDHRLSPYSSPLFFAKYLCQAAMRYNHLRYMGLFDMCHKSMPAAASHNIIAAVKGRPPKPLKTPFMINITPQRAITPPIFLHRGTIFFFPGHIFPGCQIYMSSAAGKYNAKGSKNNSQKHTDKIHNISPFSLLLFDSFSFIRKTV